MIKCKSVESCFECFQSGKRSAIMITKTGDFIRLKGCGNDI